MNYLAQGFALARSSRKEGEERGGVFSCKEFTEQIKLKQVVS